MNTHDKIKHTFDMSTINNGSLPKHQGLYIHGHPGCGKTFLMDMFFENLTIKEKLRIHFNEFL